MEKTLSFIFNFSIKKFAIKCGTQNINQNTISSQGNPMEQIEAETAAQNMICAGIPEVTASLAMDSGLVSKLEGLRDDQTVGIQVRARKMLDLLTSSGLVYEQLIPCTLLSVHPDNRSGVLVNNKDCHAKGYQALKVGWSLERLAESWCIEASPNLLEKQKQIKAMMRVVEGSDGKLAFLFWQREVVDS